MPSRIGSTVVFTSDSVSSDKDEALDALIALGFSLKEAAEALEKIDRNLSVEERIRLALKK